jgi:hypothetical protein
VTRDRGRKQSLGVLVGKPADGQRRRAGKHPLAGWVADRQQQANRLGQQPPPDKTEHLRGGFIQPLGVIDQADQRSLGGVLAPATFVFEDIDLVAAERTMEFGSQGC